MSYIPLRPSVPGVPVPKPSKPVSSSLPDLDVVKPSKPASSSVPDLDVVLPYSSLVALVEAIKSLEARISFVENNVPPAVRCRIDALAQDFCNCSNLTLRFLDDVSNLNKDLQDVDYNLRNDIKTGKLRTLCAKQ